MGKPLNSHTVPVTINLPIEVAEFLIDHGDGFIRAIRRALILYHRNPSTYSDEDTTQIKERETEKRARQLIAIGRVGYRMLRTRKRYPKNASVREKMSIRNRHLFDIAEELGVGREIVRFAIQRFSKSLQNKIRDRRRREVFRYFRQGLSNQQIAERLKIGVATVKRDLAYISKQQRREGQE